jgi:hypothetical protein
MIIFVLSGNADDEAMREAVDSPPTPEPTITTVGLLPTEKHSAPKIKETRCMSANAKTIDFISV